MLNVDDDDDDDDADHSGVDDMMMLMIMSDDDDDDEYKSLMQSVVLVFPVGWCGCNRWFGYDGTKRAVG